MSDFIITVIIHGWILICIFLVLSWVCWGEGCWFSWWHSGRTDHRWDTVCFRGEKTKKKNNLHKPLFFKQSTFLPLCLLSIFSMLSFLQVGHNTTGKQHVTPLSSSDHSDIVTLGDLKENDHVEVEEEAAVNEEFYLGTSCSSQYAFTAAETGRPAAHTHWPA